MTSGMNTLRKSLVEAETFWRSALKHTLPPETISSAIEQGVHIAPDTNGVSMVWYGVPCPTEEIERINAREKNIKCK